MKKRVTILGRTLPLWLALVVLIASGTGAAVGTVLAGKVTGEVNVSTAGSAGGLLIGAPICDYIKHTPNDVISETPAGNYDPSVFWPIAGHAMLTDLSKIDFADKILENIGTPGLPGQQVFRTYVGNAADITKIVVSYEGMATTYLVWDGTANAWTMVVPAGAGGTRTISFPVANPIVLNIDQVVEAGYFYFRVIGDPVSTDYLSITATYKSIDLAHWEGFKGPEITHRAMMVPERCIGVHSDDQTAFEAAAEIAVGDWWMFMLPVKNASKNDITARLKLNVPSCLNTYVVSADALADFNPRITRATLIGFNTWKVIVNAGASKQDDDDYLYIIINAHNDCPPAFYTITGVLEQIPY